LAIDILDLRGLDREACRRINEPDRSGVGSKKRAEDYDENAPHGGLL
jgi:hypothetical protein